MISSAKSEVLHDSRKLEPRQRMPSKLNRKHPVSHQRKSSTSTETEIPKIVKSLSSAEMPKLETLNFPKKSCPKVIEVSL
jgi:hypothetical protein